MKVLSWWIILSVAENSSDHALHYQANIDKSLAEKLLLCLVKKKASLCQRLTPHCVWVTGRIIRNMEPQKWKQCKGQSHRSRREQDWRWQNLKFTGWYSLHTEHYSCLFHNTFCLGFERRILTDQPTASKMAKSLV